MIPRMFADRIPVRETVGQRGGVHRQPERIAGTLRNMGPDDPAHTGMGDSSSPICWKGILTLGRAP